MHPSRFSATLAALATASLLSAQISEVRIVESGTPPTTATHNGSPSTAPILTADAHVSWLASPWEASWVGAVAVDPGGDEDASLAGHYQAEVDVAAAPGQAWELTLESNFWGTLINLGPLTTTRFADIEGTLLSGGVLESGSLDVPIAATRSEIGDAPIHGNASALISGEGPTTVIVAFEFEASAEATKVTLLPGSECIARFGQHPAGLATYDSTTYAADNVQLECHGVSASLALAPEVVQQPEGATLCPGEAALFQVNVEGTGPFEYRLLKGDPDATVSQLADQVTTSSATYAYTITETWWGEGWYRLQVLNDLGSTVSEYVYIDFLDAIVLPQPADVTACGGTDVVFSTPDIEGAGFTWSHGSTTLAGATATLTEVNANDAGTWMLSASGACGEASATFELTVLEAPSVALGGVGLSGCVGMPALIEATASGGPPPYTYAWRKNDVPLPDTGPTLDLNSLGDEDNGTYTVTVTDASGCGGSASESIVILSIDPIDAFWHTPFAGGSVIDDAFVTAPDGAGAANWFQLVGFVPFVSCPPTGTAFVQDDFTDSKPDAKLLADEEWSLQILNVGGVPTVPQAVEIEADAKLTATTRAEAQSGGVIRLLDGELVTADAHAAPDGLLEGWGEVEGPVRVSAAGPDSGTLHVPDLLLTGSGTTLGIDETLASAGLVQVAAFSGCTLSITNSGAASVALQNDVGGEVRLGRGTLLQVANGEVRNDELIVLDCADLAVASNDDIVNNGVITGIGRLSTGGSLVNNGVVSVLNDLLEINADVVNNGSITGFGGGAAVFINGNLLVPGVITTGLQCDNDSMTPLPNCPTPCVPAPPGPPDMLSVYGDLELQSTAQLAFGDGVIEVAEDFRSEISDPFAFRMAAATLRMNGVGILAQQAIDLAGPDLGPPVSFDAPAYQALGAIEIGPNPADVVVSGSAIYAKRLTVSAFARLDLGDAVVYADEVEVQPGGELFLGGGTLFAGSVVPADACAQGLITGDCAARLFDLPAPDCDGNGVDDATDLAFGAPDCNGNGIPDACDVALSISFDQDGEGTPDDCQAFHVDRPWLSIQAGGTQSLNLHAGAPYAAGLYVVAGSATGTGSGPSFGGVTVPLLFDNYTLMTLGGANLPPFVDTTGFLDSAGAAEAAIQLGPETVPASGIGLVLHHAYVVLDPASATPMLVSNPTSLELRP